MVEHPLVTENLKITLFALLWCKYIDTTRFTELGSLILANYDLNYEKPIYHLHKMIYIYIYIIRIS